MEGKSAIEYINKLIAEQHTRLGQLYDLRAGIKAAMNGIDNPEGASMEEIKVNPVNFPDLKAVYNKAVDNGDDVIEFEGIKIPTHVAKDIIEEIEKNVLNQFQDGQA